MSDPRLDESDGDVSYAEGERVSNEIIGYNDIVAMGEVTQTYTHTHGQQLTILPGHIVLDEPLLLLGLYLN